MLTPIVLALLLAGPAPQASPPDAPRTEQATGDQASMPRRLDAAKAENRAIRDDEPTDPWFDRPHVATDDPAFILAAVESARQGLIDARNTAGRTDDPELRAAAEKIAAQNRYVSQRLETLAAAKGWRLPEPNPGRATSLPEATPARSKANFIINQISYHENTLGQYRAQIAGHGDPQLKRVLREAVPVYEKNLGLLLTLKP